VALNNASTEYVVRADVVVKKRDELAVNVTKLKVKLADYKTKNEL